MKDQFQYTDIHNGSAPGIEHDELITISGGDTRTAVTCFDYSPGHVLIQEVKDLTDFVAHHRPEWSVVRWIRVVGLSDMNAVHALAERPTDVYRPDQANQVAEWLGGVDSLEWGRTLYASMRRADAAIGGQFSTRILIKLVGIAGRHAGAGLHRHAVAEANNLLHRLRRCGDSGLPRRALLENGDPQASAHHA